MASIALPLSARSDALPLGAKRPRICHIPPYVTSAGPEAMEVAAMVGIVPDEWQRFTLTGALGEKPDGSWSAPTVGLTVSRQNGKGTDLELRELLGLFVLGESINHTAHQQKTATNHFERVLRLIESCPDFDRQVLRAPKGKGLEAIHLRGGNVIFFATRAGGAGRGLTFDVIVYDEAMYLSEQDRSSLTPTMSARSMSGSVQTWYVGSAVDQQDPAQDGIPFAQVREQGIAGADGVAYFEFSAPGDDPSSVPDEIAADPEMWALANPALGVRISHEWVERERTVEMGPRSFAVERLGIGDWPATDGGTASKIDMAAWKACVDEGSECADPVVVVFDVTPSRTSASIGVAGWREDGIPHVEIIDDRAGTRWVAAALVKVCQLQTVTAILWDERSPAASLVTDIKAALDAEGVDVDLEPVATKEHAEACGMFFDAVTDRAVRHLGTADLLLAVRGAATRPLGDAWAWARKTSSANIAPLVTVTLAHWGLRTLTEPDGEPLVAFI